jgi:hypothetical protein
MSNGTGLEPAATDHVVNSVAGYVIGAGAVAVASAVAWPLVAPLAAAATIVGWTGGLTVLGGGLGAWIGYNRASAKAMRFGIRKS